MKKFCFTGTQGTGKTTVLTEVKKEFPELEVITEVVRRLVKEQGIKINEEGEVKTQKLIFDCYSSLINKEGFLSDRCIIDVMAYTTYLARNTKEPLATEFKWVLRDQHRFLSNNKKKIGEIFYFPIEFPVVADGVRSIDEGFRKEIDSYIKGILQSYEIPFTTVRGTVKQRCDIVLKKIREVAEL